ncbi:hypothetical protein [Gaetbulibacter saemankumensis]|uniref:hypothetical protein n=1 Tax=Gaetbulibacter saemankumensis TaxID=311208 RepID=UPI00041B9B6B|nr:hypothetical protein [Gaetbulibacter saemankumensis]
MKSLTKILGKISGLIREIEMEYPELYKHLDENPVTIPNEAHPRVDAEAMDNYLQTLRSILDKYREEQGLKKPLKSHL